MSGSTTSFSGPVSALGTINKAQLTVSANADAKFVTQSDIAGYYGVTKEDLLKKVNEVITALVIAVWLYLGWYCVLKIPDTIKY